MESAWQPAKRGDRGWVTAFVLLVAVPIVSVACTWLVVAGLDLWDYAIPGALIVVAAPPLLTAAMGARLSSAMGIPRLTSSRLVLGGAGIGLLVTLAVFVALFSAGAD